MNEMTFLNESKGLSGNNRMVAVFWEGQYQGIVYQGKVGIGRKGILFNHSGKNFIDLKCNTINDAIQVLQEIYLPDVVKYKNF